VEVRSPTDRWKGVLEKVIDHMNIGVDVVMVLDMKTTSITVFRQDEGQVTFSSKEKLVLSDILPGFAVPVAKFFE